MEAEAKVRADDPQVTISARGRKHANKLRLLTRDRLDRRFLSTKQFDAIADGIAQDLGGADRLSTVQKHLVEAFAGIALRVNDLNARTMLGQEVDVVELSQVVSTMVRVASRIGVGRIPIEIAEDPLIYAASYSEAEKCR